MVCDFDEFFTQSSSNLNAFSQQSFSILSASYQHSLSILSRFSQHSLSSLAAISQQSFSSLSAVSQHSLSSLAVSQRSFISLLGLSQKCLALSFLIQFIILRAYFITVTSSKQQSTKYFVLLGEKKGTPFRDKSIWGHFRREKEKQFFCRKA